MFRRIAPWIPSLSPASWYRSTRRPARRARSASISRALSRGSGARAAASFGPKGRYLVNGEPTDNRLALGHKGALYVRLAARGRAAHSAYPEEGESAIERMLEALERVRRVPLPHDEVLGPGTLN